MGLKRSEMYRKTAPGRAIMALVSLSRRDPTCYYSLRAISYKTADFGDRVNYADIPGFFEAYVGDGSVWVTKIKGSGKEIRTGYLANPERIDELKKIAGSLDPSMPVYF